MDTMNVTETDLGKALQEAAMLAHMKISVWDSVKTDRKVMEDVKHLHNAKGNVGHLQKNTLAGVDQPLKAARSAFAAVRVRHYELTLSWASDPLSDRKTGPRLLTHSLLGRYLTEIGQLERVANDALEEFLPKYPQMIRDAQPNLGGMFVASDYPTAEEVRSKFRIYKDLEPIADGTCFRGLPAGMIERLSFHLNKRRENQMADATRQMWTEARERIEHLIGRLAEEDTRFKEASVNAVRELVTLLPGWNLGKDERVDEIAQEIKNMLAGIDAADLRKNAATRVSVVEDARRITDRMTQWGL